MKTASLYGAIFTALATAACASSDVSVAPDAPRGDLFLEAVGSGNWSVACSGPTVRGRRAAQSIRGRGNETFDVIALRDVISASCEYETESAPLTITLEEKGLDCPFGTFTGGICRTTIPAAETGSFDFSPA